MPKKLDLTGEVYGLLTVVEPARQIGKNKRWLCQCECGNTTVVSSSNLRKGQVKSCGCLRHKGKHGERRSNGLTTPEYRAYMRMYPRPAYWDDYTEFLKDIGRRPTPNHTLSKLNYLQPHGRDNTRWLERNSQRRGAREIQPRVVVDFRQLRSEGEAEAKGA